jgi:hypothetical protein
MVALINRNNTTTRSEDIGSNLSACNFDPMRARSAIRSELKARQADKRAKTQHTSDSLVVNDSTAPSLIVID